MEQIQCPLRVDRPEQVSPVAQINYQTFLHFCETALARLPDWESKLTTPNWVEAHNLCLLPTDWTSLNVTTTKSTTGQPEQNKYLTEDDLAGTHQALLRLAEEVDKVKGRLEQIEQQSIQQPIRVPMPSPPLPGGSPLKQPPPQVSPASPSTSNVGASPPVSVGSGAEGGDGVASPRAEASGTRSQSVKSSSSSSTGGFGDAGGDVGVGGARISSTRLSS